MKLEEIIRSKGTSVVTIAPQASVADLLALLAENNIGAVVVSSDGERIEGMVSERDVVRALASAGAAALEGSVADLMSTDVVTGAPDDKIEDAAHSMTLKRVRHVPVVIDGRLHAIVSIGDVVKHRIDQLTTERNHLLGYLHS